MAEWDSSAESDQIGAAVLLKVLAEQEERSSRSPSRRRRRPGVDRSPSGPRGCRPMGARRSQRAERVSRVPALNTLRSIEAESQGAGRRRSGPLAGRVRDRPGRVADQVQRSQSARRRRPRRQDRLRSKPMARLGQPIGLALNDRRGFDPESGRRAGGQGRDRLKRRELTPRDHHSPGTLASPLEVDPPPRAGRHARPRVPSNSSRHRSEGLIRYGRAAGRLVIGA